jgi:hypothetical protein
MQAIMFMIKDWAMLSLLLNKDKKECKIKWLYILHL